MSGKCWVCKRQARGFGHSDGRFKIADPRRYPLDWVFCSRRCQDIFHTLYGRRLAAEERGEALMVDASDIEIAAMRDCLKAFGTAGGQIGFDSPPGQGACFWIELAVQEGPWLTVVVEDDGVGMEPAVRQEILGSVQVDRRIGGIGARNCNQRLVQLYGPDFALDIASAAEAGTRITFRIPVPSHC